MVSGKSDLLIWDRQGNLQIVNNPAANGRRENCQVWRVLKKIGPSQKEGLYSSNHLFCRGYLPSKATCNMDDGCLCLMDPWKRRSLRLESPSFVGSSRGPIDCHESHPTPPRGLHQTHEFQQTQGTQHFDTSNGRFLEAKNFLLENWQCHFFPRIPEKSGGAVVCWLYIWLMIWRGMCVFWLVGLTRS